MSKYLSIIVVKGDAYEEKILKFFLVVVVLVGAAVVGNAIGRELDYLG